MGQMINFYMILRLQSNLSNKMMFHSFPTNHGRIYSDLYQYSMAHKIVRFSFPAAMK